MSSTRNSTQALDRNEANKKNAAADRGAVGSKRPRAVNEDVPEWVAHVAKRRRTKYFYDDSVGVYLSGTILDVNEDNNDVDGYNGDDELDDADGTVVNSDSQGFFSADSEDTEDSQDTFDRNDIDVNNADVNDVQDSDDDSYHIADTQHSDDGGEYSDHDLEAPQVAQEVSLPKWNFQLVDHEAQPQQDGLLPLVILQPTNVLPPTTDMEGLYGRVFRCSRDALRLASPQDKTLKCSHPVLLVSSFMKDNILHAVVVMMTTFGGMTLMERFPRMDPEAIKLRSYFLPFDTTPPHPDDRVRNFTVKMTKRLHHPPTTSYLSFLKVMTLPFDRLGVYEDGPAGYTVDYCITPESFSKLRNFFETLTIPEGLDNWEKSFPRPGPRRHRKGRR